MGTADSGMWRSAVTGKDVALCDRLDDANKVAVEYRTTIGRTILPQAGPKRGCVLDSVFFGSIERATFCYGPDVDPEGRLAALV